MHISLIKPDFNSSHAINTQIECEFLVSEKVETLEFVADYQWELGGAIPTDRKAKKILIFNTAGRRVILIKAFDKEQDLIDTEYIHLNITEPEPEQKESFTTKLLNLARKEIGYSEEPPNSNRTKYGRWYGMDGQPWCAMFVSWLFSEAGKPLNWTTSKGFSYCPYGINILKKLGKWYTSNPKPGDIIFFDWQKDGISDHVGIIESVENGYIVTIEGNTSISNQSNGGAVMRRKRYGHQIAGYGRVA